MPHQSNDSTTVTAPPTADVLGNDASPVFLVGATRSGTTLLRLMLNHHPEICNFGEFEYAVKWYVGDHAPGIQEYRRKLSLDRVFRKHGWAVDDRLDYVGLVRSFLQQAVDAAHKPIAGATVHSRFDRLTDMLRDDVRFANQIEDDYRTDGIGRCAGKLHFDTFGGIGAELQGPGRIG